MAPTAEGPSVPGTRPRDIAEQGPPAPAPTGTAMSITAYAVPFAVTKLGPLLGMHDRSNGVEATVAVATGGLVPVVVIVVAAADVRGTVADPLKPTAAERTDVALAEAGGAGVGVGAEGWDGEGTTCLGDPPGAKDRDAAEGPGELKVGGLAIGNASGKIVRPSVNGGNGEGDAGGVEEMDHTGSGSIGEMKADGV
jgi:hypothetical protein